MRSPERSANYVILYGLISSHWTGCTYGIEDYYHGPETHWGWAHWLFIFMVWPFLFIFAAILAHMLQLEHIDIFLAWFAPSVLGIATKLAYSWMNKEHVSWRNICASLIIAIFVGYNCNILCSYYNLVALKGSICSLCGLASATIVRYIIKNAGEGLHALIKRVFNLNFKNKDDGTKGQ